MTNVDKVRQMLGDLPWLLGDLPWYELLLLGVEIFKTVGSDCNGCPCKDGDCPHDSRKDGDCLNDSPCLANIYEWLKKEADNGRSKEV